MSVAMLTKRKIHSDKDLEDRINPTGMYGSVELITPEAAKGLLDTMALERQRGIRKFRISQYVHARTNNQWVIPSGILRVTVN